MHLLSIIVHKRDTFYVTDGLPMNLLMLKNCSEDCIISHSVVAYFVNLIFCAEKLRSEYQVHHFWCNVELIFDILWDFSDWKLSILLYVNQIRENHFVIFPVFMHAWLREMGNNEYGKFSRILNYEIISFESKSI